MRPLSAVDACWCQGSIKQPRGFDWSNYYHDYYAVLRDCQEHTCSACGTALREHWRQLDDVKPERECRTMAEEGVPDSIA